MKQPKGPAAKTQGTDRDAERAARAAARRSWPVRRCALGEEPTEDLSATTTAAERIAMVWQLTLDAWAMSGRPIPDYPREQAPVRVIRPPRGDAGDRMKRLPRERDND
jgi:hypothetical protein